jgi:hypothetical protein
MALNVEGKVDWEEVKQLVTQSYRLIALARMLAALCLSLLIGVAGVAAGVAPPRGAGSPQTEPARPASGSSGVEDAESLARRIVPQVEEIRGLKFKAPVPVKIVDDAAARAHFTARAKKFWPEERIQAEQAAYIQLGLLPPSTDLRASLFNVLEEQAAGYYDPSSRTFFMVDDMPGSLAPLIIAHELTHALDDQYYGIDEMIGRGGEADDSATATGAVVEGSGTLVMSLFVLREMQAGRLTPQALLEFQESDAGRAERLRAAPQYLQRGLLSPYLLGQLFLLRGNLLGVMSGVKSEDLDRAFKDPPASTEQILHPEKYWDEASKDLPRPVPLPDLSAALGDGWSFTARGVLGEMNLAMLTGAAPIDVASADALSAARWTNQAAAGWGGDTWQIYSRGGDRATVLATVWDTTKDAEEFEAGLLPVEGRRSWRHGDAVVLVAGADGASSRLADAALAAAQPVPAPKNPGS